MLFGQKEQKANFLCWCISCTHDLSVLAATSVWEFIFRSPHSYLSLPATALTDDLRVPFEIECFLRRTSSCVNTWQCGNDSVWMLRRANLSSNHSWVARKFIKYWVFCLFVSLFLPATPSNCNSTRVAAEVGGPSGLVPRSASHPISLFWLGTLTSCQFSPGVSQPTSLLLPLQGAVQDLASHVLSVLQRVFTFQHLILVCLTLAALPVLQCLMGSLQVLQR